MAGAVDEGAFRQAEFHYEAWHHTGAGRLELGFHFEGRRRGTTRQAFDFFRSAMVEIKASLPRAELEPWDRGWSGCMRHSRRCSLDELVLEQRRWSACRELHQVTLQPMVERILDDRSIGA